MSGDGSPTDEPVDCSDLRVAVVAAQLARAGDGRPGRRRAGGAARRTRSATPTSSASPAPSSCPVVAQACARRGTTPSSRSASSSAAARRTSTTSARPPPTGSTGSPSTPASRSASACSPATPRSRRSTGPGWRAAARARATRPRPPRCSPHRPCAQVVALRRSGLSGGRAPCRHSRDSLGAWLLKASPAGGAVDRLVPRLASQDVTTRCVRAVVPHRSGPSGPAGAAVGQRRRLDASRRDLTPPATPPVR